MTDQPPLPPVAELLARDPFGGLAPDDPLALVIALHHQIKGDQCTCRAWNPRLGDMHAAHVAAAIRQEGLAR